MPPRERGAEDYTQQIEILDIETVWKQRSTIGLAELAARLGALSTLERRGSVVWQDNFSNGLSSWLAGYTPDVGSVDLVSSPVRLGIYAAQITTGIGGGRTAYIKHYEPASYGKGNLGVEVHITLDAGLPEFRLTLHLWTGTHWKNFSLFHDAFNLTLNYMDADGFDQPFATNVHLAAYSLLFIPFKLVVDPINDTYLRAIVAGEEYDLSMYPSFSRVDELTVAHSETFIMITSTVAASASSEVDAVIFTVQEPVA